MIVDNNNVKKRGRHIRVAIAYRVEIREELVEVGKKCKT